MEEIDKIKYFDYKMLFENMINGFAQHKIVTDEKGRVIDYIFLEANSAFEKIIGLKKAEFINKRVTEVLPGIENDPADWIGRYAKVALTGKKVKFEQYSELLKKWFEISAYSSTPGYFDVIIDDISERKISEKDREKNSDYYKYLIDSIDELVFIVSKSGKLVYVNKKTISTSGYSYEEMIDTPITKYLAKNSIKIALFALAQEFLGHDHKGLELEIVTKTGDKKFLKISSGSVMVRKEDKLIGLMVNGHDISEEKKRDEEIRFLASLPQENPNPILRVSKDGTIEYCNKPAIELLNSDGLKKGDKFDKQWGVEIGNAIEKRVVIKGERGVGENFFAYSIVPVDDKECVNIYAHDITSRIKEEKAKMKEREKAEKYLNVAAVIILAIDMHQNITLINKKGCEILEYKKEEIIGKNWFDNFLEKQDNEKIKDAFYRIMRGEAMAATYYENYVIAKSGQKKLIAWNNIVLFDDNGVPVGTLSSGEDISERKAAEKKLEKLAREWSATFDSMTDGISLVDSDSKIVNVNRALCDILAKSREEMIGKKCQEVFECLAGKIDNRSLDKSVSDSLKKIEIYDDNLKKWLFISASGIYGENGEPDKTIHVVRDVTERKKNEEETKKRSMELEKFNSLMIGREEKMIQLKRKMRELELENSRLKNEKI